jgi:hypothetical protein
MLHVRTAALTPASLDEENRTVRAILGTDAPVVSIDLKTGKGVLEVYLMDGMEPVDQVPLCDTHKRDSIERVKGSVRQIGVDGSQFTGTLSIDATETAAWSKIRGRHVTDVSAGFELLESVEIKPGQTKEIRGRAYTAPKTRSPTFPGRASRMQVYPRWREFRPSSISTSMVRRLRMRH